MRPLATLAVIALGATQVGAQSSPRPIELAPPNATLPAEFTLVSSVRELSDGRLLIVDRSEKRVVVASWSTGVVIQLGRSGSGPGEYLQPSTLFAIHGDSTVLPDAQNGRWLLLSGGSIATTVGADAPAIRAGARIPLGADDQGNVIFTQPIRPKESTSDVLPRGDSVLLVRLARATGRADTVAVIRARAVAVKIQGPVKSPTSVSITINPVAVAEQAALFPDGWIAIARLDPYRVEWIAPDGRRIRGSPLPFERVPLDRSEQRAFLERQAARTGSPVRDAASIPDWPELMPAFLSEALLRAPDGRLWIRRPATAAQPDPPYDVVDRRGVLVQHVAGGTDFDVVGFGRGVVFTVVTDDDGIQHLQRRPMP